MKNSVAHIESRGDMSVGIRPCYTTFDLSFIIEDSVVADGVRSILTNAFGEIWGEKDITVWFDKATETRIGTNKRID